MPPALSRPRPEHLRPASKSLFSQHYLGHHIQEHLEWTEDIAEPFERLRALYDAKRDILAGLNEAQTEEEFIRPALELLGFAYVPQTAVRRGGHVQRPDYALFPDARAKDEAYGHISEEPAFYGRALAIADAKYWGRPLSAVSRNDPRDEFRNTNPSFQMVNYLTRTGVDWGILTNGQTWRLYYRQASSTATEFYEVDLVGLLESGDLEEFKRFWLFFRREAFVKGPQSRNFLERVREGSTTYARVIGDRLKSLVFEEVFPLLAGGFVAYGAARGEGLTDEAGRRLVYEATLSLLYKLLFLVYAEARNLLPMDNEGYRAQSLTGMAREVAGRLDRAEPLGQTSTALYDRLLNLFQLVDRGDRGLGLLRYNSGLFHFDFSDPDGREKHCADWFLARHKVSDAVLAPALDRLARADGKTIDYGFIGVRHLGAIYEGLLEHRLVIEDARRGQVHLETDKGERKATGSYYTPDYIVKYIVQHTVGPILEERSERFATLMDRIADVRRQLADDRYTASTPALWDGLERLERQARESLLDVKVCDPAMGSGHFLVEAVDFLTDGLIEVLNQYPEHNPVLSMLDRIRQEIVASLERQGISIDPGRLDDTQLLQRVVMKRCIYGVDLNPMAVELAKVSLWLHSFTIGAPLSFLDHHLRRGNSLIGVMAREVHEQLSAEQPLFDGPFAGLLRAAETMRGTSLLSDATLAEVEESERLFRQFDEAANPYKRLLDIYVARHFGVKRADEFLRLFGPDATRAGPDTVGEPYATVMRETRRLFEEKRFFHWDLEFPEAFIDLERAAWKEAPGFDVMVGNPPYQFGENIPADDKPFLENTFMLAQSQYDTYWLFYECALTYIAAGGLHGHIVPDALLARDEAEPLRSELLLRTKLHVIAPVGPVFDDPNVSAVITVWQQSSPNSDKVQVWHRDNETLYLAQVYPQSSLAETPGRRLWVNLNARELDLVMRIIRSSMLLGDYVDVSRGEELGKKDLIDLKLTSATTAIDVPILVGEDISQLNFPEPSYCIPRMLVKKDRGNYCANKMVLVKTGRNLVATVDTIGYVTLQSVYNLNVQPHRRVSIYCLAALLKSTLLSYFLCATTTGYKQIFPQLNQSTVEEIPVRRIAFTTPAGGRARLVEAGITEATEFIEHTEGAPSVSFSASVFSRWLEERLTPIHTPDPALVRRHNADPLNEDWQLPEEGPVEQSDVVHDLLAHLAEQMIEMNKPKQAEIKGFLSWLEWEIGASIDDLANKTKLRNYLGNYQKGEPHLAPEELLAILRQNRRRLQVDPMARAFQERLEREYQASLGKLLPLKGRLAATDRLIDLIVYKLYGLTEEEVAIVEGSDT